MACHDANPRSCLATREARVGERRFDDENLDLLVACARRLVPDSRARPSASASMASSGWFPGCGDILAGTRLLHHHCGGVGARSALCDALRAWWSTSRSMCWSASVPLLGDIFDIAWKANRRNYTLLTRHLAASRTDTQLEGSTVFLCLHRAAAVRDLSRCHFRDAMHSLLEC